MVIELIVQISAVLLAFVLGVWALRLQLRYEKRVEVLNQIRARSYDIYAEIRIMQSMKEEESRARFASEMNSKIGELLFNCRVERFWLKDDTLSTVDSMVDGLIEVGKQIMGDEGYGSWFSNLMYQNAVEAAEKRDFQRLLSRLDDQARTLMAMDRTPKLLSFVHFFLINMPGSKAIRHRLKNP